MTVIVRPVRVNGKATLFGPAATIPFGFRLSIAPEDPMMQRSTTANPGRSTLILTSGIICAVLSATMFCVAYLVL